MSPWPRPIQVDSTLGLYTIKEEKMPPTENEEATPAPGTKPKRVMSQEQKDAISRKLKKYQRDLKAGKIKPGEKPAKKGKKGPKKGPKASPAPTPVVAATVPSNALPALQEAMAKYTATVKAAKAELRATVIAHTK